MYFILIFKYITTCKLCNIIVKLIIIIIIIIKNGII